MGLLRRLGESVGLARKSSYTDEVLKRLFVNASDSGISVTTETALKASAVLACGRVLSEGLAQLPLRLYRPDPKGRGAEVAYDHPLYDLLNLKPNDFQTSFEFTEQKVLHAAIAGNAYALKVRANDGRVLELLPLLPSWVEEKRDANWRITYDVRLGQDDNGGSRLLKVDAANMLHLRGPSWDGIRGMEFFRLAREAIGLALVTEKHHSKMHANGAKTGGVLSVEGTLSTEQYSQLRQWLETEYEGASNAGRTIILDHAAKFTSNTMTGVDSQHLETRRFQIEEVCRFMRVFPQMVMQSDKTSTYASAEQFFLAHVVHSLGPWIRRDEQKLSVDLLTPEDRAKGLYPKYAVQGLLRGDAKTRSDFYQKAILSGWMTRNEARALEELNPIDGLDEPLTPTNMGFGADPTNDPPKP